MENGRLILFFVAHSKAEADEQALKLKNNGYKTKITHPRARIERYYVYGRAVTGEAVENSNLKM